MNKQQLEQTLEGFKAIEEGLITIEDAGMTKLRNAQTKDQQRFILALKRLYDRYKDCNQFVYRMKKEANLLEAGESSSGESEAASIMLEERSLSDH